MSAQPRSHQRGVAIVLIGGVLGSGLAFWLTRREHEPPVPIAARESIEIVDVPREPSPPSPIPEAAKTSPPRAVLETPVELASDGVPLMRAQGDSTLLGPRHPHPITAQHRRIYRENTLLGALNGAVDAGDPEALRRLTQRYRDEYPEDGPQLQTGYELIADCLDHLDPETVARARRYFDEERGSTLRRYVKRYCL